MVVRGEIMHKLTLPLLLLALLALPSLCFAFESIEFVTKERAKELGLVIKTNGAGPDAVYIELSFEKQGEMKSYSRVALEMHAEGKLLMTSTLREEQSEPGKVV